MDTCLRIHFEKGREQPRLALILDMDGVLVDSNPIHRQAWRAYNLRFGIETDETMQERMYGRHNDDIVRDFFGSNLSAGEVARHGAAKESLYRELMTAVLDQSLVPGVRAFLERHAAAPLALASNAEPANVAFVLDRSGLRHYFRVVIDGDQVRKPKPDPEMYLLTARRLGVRPSQAIVFEDSEAGLTAARAAGMRTVGVRTTHSKLPGAGLEIDDFLSRELEPWLRTQTQPC